MLQELRHAARILRKSPGFALIAILSIALGTGANVAMFSAADANLLRPLPVPRPADLLTVGSVFSLDNLFNALVSSYPDYLDIQKRARSWDGLAAYTHLTVGFRRGLGEPAQARMAALATDNFFDVLGVPPAVGREFRADEDGVVVLGFGFWRDRFSMDPEVLGRRVWIGSEEATVVGIAPESFTGINLQRRPSFYLPLAMWPRLIDLPGILNARDSRALTLKGRLKKGIGVSQARAELAAISADLERAYPATNRDRHFTARTEFQERVGEQPVRIYGIAIIAMLAIAVLLAACFNVAGLLSSRAPARAKEIAVRLAVGGSRWRLIRQLLAESAIVAAAGGLVALPVGYAGIALLRRVQLGHDLVQAPVPQMDQRALAFTLAIAISSVFLFGLVPAIQTTRADLVNALKAGGAPASRLRLPGRNLLVAGQVAIALVLLTVSAFVYGVFRDELQQGPGFRTDHRLLMTFDPGLAGYSDGESDRFFEKLLDRARATPGVLSATVAQTIPLDSQTTIAIAPEGRPLPPGKENATVWANRVDESYFDTLGVPIARGRAFLKTDTTASPRVAILNQTLVAHYWPGEDPVGKRFRLASASGPPVQIVGVARNGEYLYPGEPPAEFVYFPRRQDPRREMTLVAASAGPAAALAAPLREAVRDLDANLPVYDIRTIEDFYKTKAIDIGDVTTDIVGAMGITGLLLAMVGLYALMSHSVSRRVREIGIRMAVGADRASVVRMILKQAMILAAAGAAAGLALSAATARLLRLYPLNHTIGPRLYWSITPVLLAIAVLAAYLPARRASRVDPIAALRDE